MFNRKDLKRKAKIAFKNNYLYSVLVSLVLTVFYGAGVKVTYDKATNGRNLREFYYLLTEEEAMIFLTIVTGIVVAALSVGIIQMLLKIFIFDPYKVGLRNFFLKNETEFNPTFLDTLCVFKKNGGYLNIVKTIFMKDLIICLWSFVFVIPGIIKSYQYALTDYIVVENPNLTWKEVLKKSKQMMVSNKWAAFILDLSFIGWAILSIIPLVGPLFVKPYIHQTDAELYLALKNQ